MEDAIKQVDKRASSNGQAANPRIIIDASYIRGMKKDGTPLRAISEQGGRIVLTDTLMRELYSTSDSNQWAASRRKLVECRDAIEVWAHVSEMYRAELRENRPYGDPLHLERTERFREMLANDLQYEPNNRDEIIEKTSQEREGSAISELFQNFAELSKEPKFESSAAKIKGKNPHDEEVVQTCYDAINDPKSIRSMVEIIRSVLKNNMDVSLNPKDVDAEWAIWHFSKLLLTVLCDCLRQGERLSGELSEKHKKRLCNTIYDLDYFVSLAFADALATRRIKEKMSYYRLWMFGGYSRPLIRCYENEQIDRFIRELRQKHKIAILVLKQLDGYTCALDLRSRASLNSETLPASVYISRSTRGHFELFSGSTWKNTVEILTDHSVEEIQAFGGVVFVDTNTRETLFEPAA